MTTTRRTLLAASAAIPFMPRIPTMPARKILLIVADDIGWDLWGSSPHPNLDCISWRVYHRFWAGPRCANARARLFTGLESWRPQNLMGWGQTENGYTLPVGAHLLPSRIAAAGRVPVFFGKLHTAEDALTDWPLDAGFAIGGAWTMRNLGAGLSTGFYDWYSTEGGPLVHQTQYATSYICEQAEFELSANEQNFLMVSLHEAHAPYDLPPANLAPISFAQGTPTTDAEIARAKVEAMDTCLGPILSIAQANGYTIIYCSDNGTSAELGGGKETLYESGLCVPLMVAGPGVMNAGSYRLVQITDLHATILELMGIDAPAQADSLSFAAHLFGTAPAPRQFLRADKFAPSGSPPNPMHWGRAVSTPTWKLLDNGTAETPRYELYDMTSDPTEATNLYPPATVAAQSAFSRLVGELPGEQP